MKLLLISCLALPVAGFAQPLVEPPVPVKLDDYNVTANREAAQVADIAAATFSLDRPALEATGGSNLFDMLRFSEGVLTQSLGPAGQSWAGMTSKTILRGADKGTLVLVDGVPMNLNGYYNLEDLPLQTVRRVETVRGASSALYGSEAASGVINILTDYAPATGFSAELGSDDYRNVSASVGHKWTYRGQPGGVGVTGVLQNIGRQKELSATGYGLGGSDRKTGRLAISHGEWALSYQHTQNVHSFERYGDLVSWSTASITQVAEFDDRKDFVRLRGAGARWQANAYANLQQRDYRRTSNVTTKPKIDRDEEYSASTAGGDVQTRLELSWAELLVGATFERDRYDNQLRLTGQRSEADRTSGSLFARASRRVDRWTASLGVRESYASTGDLTAFTPQFQLLRRLDGGFTAYANVGRSFNMPSLRQLFDSSGVFFGSNASLEPEMGWNYEAGVKWEGRSTLARVSVYTMDLDSITYVYRASSQLYVPENAPFRNTGVELSVRQQLGGAWAIDLGGSYANPEEKLGSAGAWSPKFGRWQGNALLRWQTHRWFASAGVAWLGDRPLWRDQVTTLVRGGVSLDRIGRVICVIDNVLDRRDVTTHSTAAYFSTPRAVRVGYEKTF